MKKNLPEKAGQVVSLGTRKEHVYVCGIVTGHGW